MRHFGDQCGTGFDSGNSGELFTPFVKYLAHFNVLRGLVKFISGCGTHAGAFNFYHASLSILNFTQPPDLHRYQLNIIVATRAFMPNAVPVWFAEMSPKTSGRLRLLVNLPTSHNYHYVLLQLDSAGVNGEQFLSRFLPTVVALYGGHHLCCYACFQRYAIRCVAIHRSRQADFHSGCATVHLAFHSALF